MLGFYWHLLCQEILLQMKSFLLIIKVGNNILEGSMPGDSFQIVFFSSIQDWHCKKNQFKVALSPHSSSCDENENENCSVI